MDFVGTGCVYPGELEELDINGSAYQLLKVKTDVLTNEDEPFLVHALVPVGSIHSQQLQRVHKKAEADAAKKQVRRVEVGITMMSLGMESVDHPHAKKSSDSLLPGVLHKKNQAWGLLSKLSFYPPSEPVTNHISGVVKLCRNHYGNTVVDELKEVDLMTHPWSPAMCDGVKLRVLGETDQVKAFLKDSRSPECWAQVSGTLLRKSSEADLEKQFPAWDRLALHASFISPCVMEDERSAKTAAEAALMQTKAFGDADAFDGLGVEADVAVGHAADFDQVWGSDFTSSLSQVA